MKQGLTLLQFVTVILLFSSCEPTVTPNDYQDYTAPRVIAMYPSDHPDHAIVYSNASFYIQFDDRMDPTIAAFDSDALIMENISLIPPVRIPLTFNLVNADTCLIANFDAKDINIEHIYRIRITDKMKNFSRIPLQNWKILDRYFFINGILKKKDPYFSINSHTNNDLGGRTIHLTGTCQNIETLTVFFSEYNKETSKTFRLPYGSTNWSVSYLVDTAIINEEAYAISLIAAPYASPRRLTKTVTIQLDLQPPKLIIDWPYTAGLIATNNCEIKGITFDNNRVTNIQIQVGTSNPINIGKNFFWNYSLCTTNLHNGETTLTIQVHDQAGNCTIKSIPIIITNQ